MASSDLNEDRITELLAEGSPIDSFGVGTELATSFDAPAVSAVYKMVEIAGANGKRYVAKYSVDKRTYPGAKQVFRYPDRDIIGCSAECAPDVLNATRPHVLLRPVIAGGNLVEPLPSTSAIRDYCAQALSRMSRDHKVEYSPQLLAISERHRSESNL